MFERSWGSFSLVASPAVVCIEKGGCALVHSSMSEVEGAKGVYAHLELLAWPIVIGYLVEAHSK